MINYLQVNYDGTISQYSKEPKEGFEEIIRDGKSKGYSKKWMYGAEGVLSRVVLRQNQYKNNAQEVQISLKNGEDINVIIFTLYDKNNSIDDFAKSFLIIADQLELGRKYSINNWRFNQGDIINGEPASRSMKGLTFKLEGTKLKTKLTREHIKNRGTAEEEHVPGDIPMLKWSERGGKPTPTGASVDKQIDFYIAVLERNLERLSESNYTSTTQEQASTPAATSTTMPDVGTEDHSEDDLPF